VRIERTHSVGLYKVPSESNVWMTYCRDCSKYRGSMYTCDEVARRFPQRMADAQYKYAMDYLKKNKSVDSNTMALSRKARDTSREAVAKNLGRAGTKKRTVYNLIVEHGGLTDDEIEVLTGHTHQSASSSRNKLMNDGFVIATEERRRTRQGQKAIVWKAAS
jgi:hypothetical protein